MTLSGEKRRDLESEISRLEEELKVLKVRLVAMSKVNVSKPHTVDHSIL